MSEIRLPDEVILHRLPQNRGKKTSKNCLKYELFYAWHWALQWSPGDEKFFPKPPLHTENRQIFWKEMCRVRINGKWQGKRAKYHFFTRDEVAKMVFD